MTAIPVSIGYVRRSNGERFEQQGSRPTPEVHAALGR